ncbi:pyridoxal 5'-phosphate binding protein [Erysipelotrichaceae bacterium]|nr:pyridoxal 5'-phosphate binding protein [Erysipelotrichaceae bacterium]
MFLTMTTNRNQELIDFAVELHQKGQILPDTYVIDVDTLCENARMLACSAKEYGIELYYMTKQIGRNPYLAKKIHEAGIKKAVVVDFKEALLLMDAGLPLGNVGHLVQIPNQLLKKILAYGTDYVTIYSIEMLKKVDAVAGELGIIQPVLLRILDEGDRIYEGQYGGFMLDDLPALMQEFKKLLSIRITGLTSFPCFLYQAEQGEFMSTPNAQTLYRAQILLNKAGFAITQLNMPSATCVRSLKFLAEIGGTQGEPGHALTGTTPMHAKEVLAEKPALVYVSEISHRFKGKSYCYGGGYYRRGNLSNALIATKGMPYTETKVSPFDNESIDYYLELAGMQPQDATVIMAFRTQIFVTRSEVALVEGLSTNTPKLVGIYDSLGKKNKGDLK